MALWSLNCGGDVDISYIETLEGTVYSFRFRWNDTDESWTCYVGLQGEDPSVKFKMTNGFDLLKPYKYLDGVPKGSLLFFDTVKTNGRPDFDHTSIDGRYQVYYVDSTGIDS